MNTLQKEFGTRRATVHLFFESLLDWTTVEGWGHYRRQGDRFLLSDNELSPVVLVIIEPSEVELTEDHENEFCDDLEAWDVRFGISTNLRVLNVYRRDVRDGVRKVTGMDLMWMIGNTRLTLRERDAILAVRKIERARFMKIEDVTKYC